ncbi:MAG: energy-coupling factor ABC transporter ATP-binding protein [Anaerolinea sp.]|nr:energy-coupling factor ABC transporter ATP-binding protein [Anaerolinea sp.]
MSSPVIMVEELSFRYPDGQTALSKVSFQVYAGEKVALIGPNGAGKSTLLLHLNGVLRGTTGSLTIAQMPLTEANLGPIRASVGLVFQNPDDQLFSPRVYQDVAFGPLNMRLPENEVRSRVTQALAAVGLGGFENRISHHLSGGEKKRVAIASVLSMEPKILVLDEPSAGLDPRTRRSLIQLLGSLQQQTMLISTHDMRLAETLCNRVIVLDGGKIVADGPASELLHDQVLMELHGLETP